jgi:dihydroorotate dehydrogenase (fumarate)
MSIDLSVRYLGLELRNPLVASSGPLTRNLDAICRLDEAGLAAVVLPSLFEEEIEHHEHQVHDLYELHGESFTEAQSHFPELDFPEVGTNAYLRLLDRVKRVLQIPVIASLNGCSLGGWTGYARQLEEAGADALELNIYFVPTDPDVPAADIEARYIDLAAAVCQSVTIPVAVKIGSQFSSLPHFARQLAKTGIAGLVLFNRYLEPDIDLERLAVQPELTLSSPPELRLPLRWIAILRDQIDLSLAASTGIHSATEALKALLVGADVAMVTATLLRRGPEYGRKMLQELESWMEEHEYVSVRQLQGSMSHGSCQDPSALERGNYMQALARFTSDYIVPPPPSFDRTESVSDHS